MDAPGVGLVSWESVSEFVCRKRDKKRYRLASSSISTKSAIGPSASAA
jgi:hypothetical protein